MSTKQATKSKDATISRQDAMVLIKNMVRISISSICFIRDLFPPECFKNKQYGQVDIHQLQGAKKEDNGDVTVHHEDAFLLTQWLEQGVFMALEDEYMSALVFAIYTQHPISGKDLLLETYEFKFAYPDGSGAAKINDVALVSKDTVKSQAAKFIRSLTEFTHTLDDLPVERWISLQLKYTDETPADYEPDYFTASDGSISAIADRFRLKINFGNIKTPTLDMRVKYCGLDSLLFDDLCEVSERGEGRQRVKPESVFSGTNFSEASNEAVHATLNSPRTLSSPLTETMQRLAVSPLPSRPKPEEKPETPTSMVKKFILTGNAINAKSCGKALGLTDATVRLAFKALVEDGTIKKKGKSYKLDTTGTEATQAATDTLLNSSASQTLPPAPPSSPMTVVSSAAPNAPRKNSTIVGKMDIPTDAVSAGSTHLADDIEESFHDDKQDKGKGKSAGQVGIRKQLTLAKSNSSAALSAQVAVLPAENRKRPLQDDEDVNFSQTSEISETGEPGTKRAKKFSVIRDPIYLNANVPGVRKGISVME